MKCLLCYEWVKLPRNNLPVGKGVMGAWAKLASRVAYRKGTAKYCGYENEVNAGMWAGGVVGLKSILGIKNRTKALAVLDELVRLGLVSYTLDEKTKKLELTLSDWVHNCDGSDCMSNSVYVTEGYGFLCIPRNITERLVEQNYTFEEADAWLDLWCHTVHFDFSNAFSFAAPAVQYGKEGSILTLETLGKRWNWEKTKVWRFMRKHQDTFALRRLPGSFGCVIFNAQYPDDKEYSVPESDDVTSKPISIASSESIMANPEITATIASTINVIFANPLIFPPMLSYTVMTSFFEMIPFYQSFKTNYIKL